MPRGRRLLDERAHGRLFGQQAQRAHRAARSALRAGRSEARRAPEAVVKVVSYGKAARSAQRLAAYITRTDQPAEPEGPQLAAEDEMGAVIPPAQIAAHMATWPMIADRDNLSRRAQAARPDVRRGMAEKDRLHHRQVCHMVLSCPPQSGATRETVETATRETLKQAFRPGDNDRRYLFAVHTDHSSRPHAHVVFRTRDVHGAQLQLQPEDLQIIRGIFAAECTRLGVPLRATAREDRAAIVERMRQGEAPARPAHGYGASSRRRGGRAEDAAKREGRSQLARTAPAWYARHGAAYEAERGGSTAAAWRAPPPPAVTLPALPARSNKVLEEHFRGYGDPAGARMRFLELAAVNQRAAYWASAQRPELFGPLAEPQARPAALTQGIVRLPGAWLDEARKRINDANATEEPGRGSVRLAAARGAAAQLKGAAAERRRFHADRVQAVAAERFGVLPGMASVKLPPRRPAPQTPAQAVAGSPEPEQRSGALGRLWAKIRAGRASQPPAAPAAQAGPPQAPGEAKRAPTQAEIEARAKAIDPRARPADGQAPTRGPGRGRSRGRDE